MARPLCNLKGFTTERGRRLDPLARRDGNVREVMTETVRRRRLEEIV